MNITPLATIFLATAILIAALSLPLIMRKIRMNYFYGVRFPQSFKSESNWYEINHQGGKILLLSTIPIFIMALLGLLFPTSFGTTASTYAIIGAIVTCISLCSGVFVSYVKAKQIENRNNQG